MVTFKQNPPIYALNLLTRRILILYAYYSQGVRLENISTGGKAFKKIP